MVNNFEMFYDEETLLKVYDSMGDAGIVVNKRMDAVSSMVNKGVRFREIREKKLVSVWRNPWWIVCSLLSISAIGWVVVIILLSTQVIS
jgi:hypothetical protein